MKKYIIDTHIFLWLVFDTDKIEPQKLEILKDPTNRVCISSITFWEISLKYNLGKLELQGLTPDELPKVAKIMDIEVIEIDKEIMASFYKLPKLLTHKDPFDRIIIWKCINDNFVLISQDNKFGEYREFGLRLF